MKININGKTVNVIKVKAIQNNGAWLNVYVDNADNHGIPVACHSVPKQWFDSKEQAVIKTGGNVYKHI